MTGHPDPLATELEDAHAIAAALIERLIPATKRPTDDELRRLVALEALRAPDRERQR